MFQLLCVGNWVDWRNTDATKTRVGGTSGPQGGGGRDRWGEGRGAAGRSCPAHGTRRREPSSCIKSCSLIRETLLTCYSKRHLSFHSFKVIFGAWGWFFFFSQEISQKLITAWFHVQMLWVVSLCLPGAPWLFLPQNNKAWWWEQTTRSMQIIMSKVFSQAGN